MTIKQIDQSDRRTRSAESLESDQQQQSADLPRSACDKNLQTRIDDERITAKKSTVNDELVRPKINGSGLSP